MQVLCPNFCRFLCPNCCRFLLVFMFFYVQFMCKFLQVLCPFCMQISAGFYVQIVCRFLQVFMFLCPICEQISASRFYVQVICRFLQLLVFNLCSNFCRVPVLGHDSNDTFHCYIGHSSLQKQSKANIANREKMKTKHRCGSRSIPVRVEKLVRILAL